MILVEANKPISESDLNPPPILHHVYTGAYGFHYYRYARREPTHAH